jgi:hypothetical protein
VARGGRVGFRGPHLQLIGDFQQAASLDAVCQFGRGVPQLSRFRAKVRIRQHVKRTLV